MISVVIPARNEAHSLPQTLKKLRKIPEVGEIWVCDGGSSDNSREAVLAAGAHFLEGASGRGAQINMGARHATGETLWFLHADCWPEARCGAALIRAAKCGASGGNFRLKFRAKGIYPRLFERIARAQRQLGIYYGDSGIWASREAFWAIGGFQNWPLFEDYDFARRLEKHGPTLCLAPRVHASARRFQKSPARVLALWLELQTRFSLGQSPHDLARIYRGKAGV